jgi:hypothetical protein
MKLVGGCNCGGVRYELDGEPLRVGLCHCETCRKESGSAFAYFGVWPKDKTVVRGEVRRWAPTGRRFCPQCGSSVFGAKDGSDEIEFKLGTLDRPPTSLRPIYEVWTIRREGWLDSVPGNDQHDRDAPST